MPFALLKYGLNPRRRDAPQLKWPSEIKKHYDVVIIGAGGHGLATAYYLATRHGITNIAVLDKAWMGGGNTARNTTIIRANYLTPEGVAFYKESVELFRGLSQELDINIMYSERGHFTLAHTDAAMRTARWRAEVNKHLGVDSEVVDAKDVARLCPIMNVSEDVRYPVLGALYHPPGALARHDAIAWGYAKGAMARGVEVHPGTEVVNILKEGDRVIGVDTSRGKIFADKVVQAVAGSSSRVSALAGFRLPIKTIPLQACVSEPVKPILDQIVVSGSLHVYISQSARGEMVMGGATDPYGLYSSRSTLDFKEGLMAHMLELFPFMAELRVLRQWAGIADMTPDFSPVMGLTPVRNYYIDSGWGTWGFKATPVCGFRMAECVATGRQPELLAPFALGRFGSFDLVGEKGAASVGH
ncbi:MAG: FAD-dependent oxidoreductase [Bradyrhizobium sp.]|uniref:FAD-dependent oxidoreductase n=1 Tax=Bradyrhizobium sp. TaxID=376 RepID=UPI0011FA1BD2|nr:FAD-dependent oxidoreductase [Bradyrhizobium sp.]THD75224.1 MAG: FAD-dependent oxidoreductase [Bradyrhizobium sp.]